MKDTDRQKQYSEARAYWSEWRTRAIEDLQFSNPANPKQWTDEAIRARGRGRPALVFDQTNQYIMQVVNDGRQQKPGIEVVPGDGLASEEAAEIFGGMIRYTEYVSRAGIAYDTALESACRIGLGFILVVPEVVDPRYNYQDMRIKRVINPLDVTFDPQSVEPDGQDAEIAWMETMMSEAQYRRRWPKAKLPTQGPDGWFRQDGVKVCQSWEKVYSKTNRIVLMDGRELGEDEYWEASQKAGRNLLVHSTYTARLPKVKWRWECADEVLDETDYPSNNYIGLIPVYGNELWVDNRREICGMVRRMRDPAMSYNYERSAYIEAVALSPKAPWIAPAAAIAKYQTRWEASNRENAAVLPYDHLDSTGNLLPAPQRMAPPAIASAYVENAQMAIQDIQASVGMFKASLGQNSNAKSGVAIGRLQVEGDTATFHYIDNLNRSIEQLGRVIMDSAPVIWDQPRIARIVGLNGGGSFARVDAGIESAFQDGDIPTINPAIGTYDVRIKAGPSYTSMREELTQRLVEISNGNPQLGAALAPMILKMADVPEAEQVSKVAMALLPPEVRAAYEKDDKAPELPPQVMAQIQQMQQQNEQLMGALQELQSEHHRTMEEKEMEFNRLLIDAYGKETDRLKALGGTLTPEMVQQIAYQTFASVMQAPPLTENIAHELGEPEQGQMPMQELAEMPATGAYPGLADGQSFIEENL